MKVLMTRDCGGKAAGTVHDLTQWAARNFIRMRAAKPVCPDCGEAPRNIDNHGCTKRLVVPLNRQMPIRETR